MTMSDIRKLYRDRYEVDKIEAFFKGTYTYVTQTIIANLFEEQINDIFPEDENMCSTILFDFSDGSLNEEEVIEIVPDEIRYYEGNYYMLTLYGIVMSMVNNDITFNLVISMSDKENDVLDLAPLNLLFNGNITIESKEDDDYKTIDCSFASITIKEDLLME